jgi:hypothetical protein
MNTSWRSMGRCIGSSNVKPAGINFLVRHGGIGVYSMNNGLGETGEGVGGLKRGFISNINTLGA